MIQIADNDFLLAYSSDNLIVLVTMVKHVFACSFPPASNCVKLHSLNIAQVMRPFDD